MTEGHPEFKKLLDEMWAVHCKKGADYGTDQDRFHNVRDGADAICVEHWKAAFGRMNDKMIRIRAFIRNGKLSNEGVEDSLMDIANYAIIALILFRESA